MNIKKLRAASKKEYQTIGRIYSPALKTNIIFSPRGFRHLIYKNNGRTRKVSEQYLKLKLLTFVPFVINNATEVYEARSIVNEKYKYIYWYALTYDINEYLKIKVIIERRGLNGKFNFLSVMRIKKRR